MNNHKQIPLPVDAVLPDVLAALHSAGAVVLRASTGAGKTTRVPPAIVLSEIGGNGTVLLIEPRRVAARAAARRMASESQTILGNEFGYHVRFDKKCGRLTRCIVLTSGILLRYLIDDPYLESVSTVIFDEFHERGIDADLALGLCKLLRESVKPDLKIIVMSATVDPAPLSHYLKNCPVIVSEGRSYPVTIRYQPKRVEITWPEATANAIRKVAEEQSGDVLAFLPGLREIRLASELLESLENAVVIPLHGDLPPEQQDRALQKHSFRKIVLATNVAETSVTVEGITAVIDTGLARSLRHDPSIGMDRLELGPISRASADQRAGRAGRTQAGMCIRLWDEVGHRSRAEQAEPEIKRVDLAGPILQLLAMGESNLLSFPWLDSPTPAAVSQAIELLHFLEFLKDNRLTADGLIASRLPIHPRLCRLLITGHHLGVAERSSLAAAILSERDPIERSKGPPDRNFHSTDSDLLDRIEAMEEFQHSKKLETPIGRLNHGAARFVLDSSQQLLRTIQSELNTAGAADDRDAAILQAIYSAYSDRLCKRRAPNDRRAVVMGGKGVRLGISSGVNESDLFVAIDLDASGADALVRMASAVKREWLSPHLISTRNEIEYDSAADQLIARKRSRYGDLILEDTAGHISDEAEANRIMIEAAKRDLSKSFPIKDSPAGELILRINWLKQMLPEIDLPVVEDAALLEVLPIICQGKRSLAAVQNGPWIDVVRSMLSYQQMQMLDREAPSHITVPTGSQIALSYELGKPPVLAVRIQEMFGMAETPRIAGNRVPVLLHLLAPNYRPQQVTNDLASFWKNGYPIIRKELRGRYPKHSWPEDPLNAEAIRGPKKKASQ